MDTFMRRRGWPSSMSLRPATDLFSEWADVGRDEGMERGHSASVDVMLDHKCKPFLLEVNHSPSFSTDSPLDEKVKGDLIKE